MVFAVKYRARYGGIWDSEQLRRDTIWGYPEYGASNCVRHMVSPGLVGLNGINAEFLTCADWQTEEDLLCERFSIAKPIAGTRWLHGFKPLSKSILRAWEFSASSAAREVLVVKDTVRERQRLNSELLLDILLLNMMGNGGLLMLMKYSLKVMKYL